MKPFLENVEKRALWSLQRMRHMRNQAVHTDTLRTDAAYSLSRNALHILDAAFEVIPFQFQAGTSCRDALKSVWNDYDAYRKMMLADIQGMPGVPN